ncbi:MAG: site-specific integrase [Pseudomonadota bacterium]
MAPQIISAMSETQYLKQRGQGWYVRIRVPKSLKHILGTEITRSLKTRSLAEARRLRWPVVAEIKQQIDDAVQLQKTGPSSPEWVMLKTRDLMARVAAGEISPDDARDIGLEHILETHYKASGYEFDGKGHPVIEDSAADAQITAAIKLANTGKITLASSVLDDYLAEKTDSMKARTIQTKRTIIESFIRYVGDMELPDYTRQMAGNYVTRRMTQRGNSTTTVKNQLSHLNAFFEWCLRRGVVEQNVFAGMGKTIESKTGGRASSSRRAWTETELKTLLNGLPSNDPALSALTLLALYTGARQEEICQLTTGDIHENALRIATEGATYDGKTEAARRIVPIHPVIQRLVVDLVSRSEDGFLIPGLDFVGPDRRRANRLGKRFVTLRKRLGLGSKSTVFHSLRNTFMEGLEAAKVPLPTAKLIVGHSRSDLTYGGYSKKVPIAVLNEAIQRLSFGSIDLLAKRCVIDLVDR